MNDQLWQTVRYVLIGGGSYLAGRGKISVPVDQIPAVADEVIRIASGLTALIAAAWGLYVKFRTRAVPITTAQRTDVPTVSPLTGSVESPKAFTRPKKRSSRK